MFDANELSDREPEEPTSRGSVKEFSEKSRQRLRLSLASVDQKGCGRPIFAGLTYPAEFPWDYQIFKKHLDAFGKRFRREFPHAGFHWKLEFQKRGAPHFHPIFWNLTLSPDKLFLHDFRAWLRTAWFDVVGSNDSKHLEAGTSADVIKSQFGIMRYVGGYVSNTDQTKPGEKVGRYWGVIGRGNIPWAEQEQIELTPAEGSFVRRTARRYMNSVNRQRRVRHAQKCPGGPEFYLSGGYRRLRKSHGHMECFKHRPKKLQLKNNRNVNLFCDADQWLGALSRLRIGRARPDIALTCPSGEESVGIAQVAGGGNQAS